MTPKPENGKETDPAVPALPLPVSREEGALDSQGDEMPFPTSLNDELAEKLRDNPNRFIGCGG